MTNHLQLREQIKKALLRFIGKCKTPYIIALHYCVTEN